MSEERVTVPAGERIYAETGQYLVVTDLTAVWMHGRLYHTELWATRSKNAEEAWASRSWWRKLLGAPPRGYEPEGLPVSGSMFGSLFGSLF